MSAIIGTTVTIVFKENIAKATKELGNNELESMLREEVAVVGDSLSATWLNNRIAIAGVPSELGLEPFTVKTKMEMIEFLRGHAADNTHQFVASITTYPTKLKKAGLDKEFSMSYQSPSKNLSHLFLAVSWMIILSGQLLLRLPR